MKVATWDGFGGGDRAMKRGTEPIGRRVVERCAVRDRVHLFYFYFFVDRVFFFRFLENVEEGLRSPLLIVTETLRYILGDATP